MKDALRAVRGLAFALAIVLGVAASARAQGYLGQGYESQAVQIAPLAAWGFGGSVRDVATGESRSFDAAPVYGGALDIRFRPGWYAELYASRQKSTLGGGLAPSFDVSMERYLLGIQQEKGDEQLRAFGTFYLGATRFVPGLDAFGSETRFTGGVGLGVKAFLTRNVGIRLEARGFYTVVEAESGLLCVNGDCLFAFSGSGLWQGDVGGGLIIAF